MNETITFLQKESIVNLCHYLCRKYEISTINAHKELASTECPGIYFSFKQIHKKLLEKILNSSTYTVKSGDTLWSISKKFNISIEKLKLLNGLTGNIIYPNQIFKLL